MSALVKPKWRCCCFIAVQAGYQVAVLGTDDAVCWATRRQLLIDLPIGPFVLKAYLGLAPKTTRQNFSRFGKWASGYRYRYPPNFAGRRQVC